MQSILQCNGKTCYDEIVRTKKICQPAYNTAGQNYLSLIPIGTNYLLIIAVMIWLLLVLRSILEIILINKRHKLTNFDDKLALGMAALMFSGCLVYLCIDKFERTKFCLMNYNDPLCEGSNETSCFTQNRSSVFADNFGFGGFIEIGSGIGFFNEGATLTFAQFCMLFTR